jgi:hypothetical protein
MEKKDTPEQNSILNGQGSTQNPANTFYNKHNTMSVILKKTEKIVTAVYMVTDFIDDREPLRFQLRTVSLNILSVVRKMASRAHDPHYAIGEESGLLLEEITALITIASTIGLISEMNGSILTSEFKKVQYEITQLYGDKQINVRVHPGYAGVILTPEMFNVPGPVSPIPSIIDKGQEISKGQTVGYISQSKQHQSFKMTGKSFSKKSDIGIKIARRNDVLNVVKSKGKVSIKDVVSILKDISEKTVQRELLALVNAGVLKKEGEKRWSTYRIAS